MKYIDIEYFPSLSQRLFVKSVHMFFFDLISFKYENRTKSQKQYVYRVPC